jgi:hypothetical protein
VQARIQDFIRNFPNLGGGCTTRVDFSKTSNFAHGMTGKKRKLKTDMMDSGGLAAKKFNLD